MMIRRGRGIFLGGGAATALPSEGQNLRRIAGFPLMNLG